MVNSPARGDGGARDAAPQAAPRRTRRRHIRVTLQEIEERSRKLTVIASLAAVHAV